jgi:hypothetical protein
MAIVPKSPSTPPLDPPPDVFQYLTLPDRDAARRALMHHLRAWLLHLPRHGEMPDGD